MPAGVAVVRSDGAILGEALASQAALHEEWGGVVPSIARDAHTEALEATVELALSRAGLASAAEVHARTAHRALPTPSTFP